MSTHRIHNGLGASERLQLRKQIETLFRCGEAFSVFPLRIIYSLLPVASELESPVRVGFSIPKKKVKKAVHRNRIRRLLKEAWRLHKHDLYAAIPPGKQLHVFLVFTGTESLTFTTAVATVKGAQHRLKELLRKNTQL